MKKEDYLMIERYMLTCMDNGAHDAEHIYRVLFNALDIASHETVSVNYDVLIAACLLHDISRIEQQEGTAKCHARAGSKKAFKFLVSNGFDKDFATHTAKCIATHRFRKGEPPQSIEAKILFDADKLDVTGAIGIARTLLYQGLFDEPLYTDEDFETTEGKSKKNETFFTEYKKKLAKLYDIFFTERGREVALTRRKIAQDYRDALADEILFSKATGKIMLEKFING